MNPKVLIKEIVEEIKSMPAKDIKTIADFVGFVKEKELEEELLASKKIIKAVKVSKRAWKEKRLTEFVSWEDLKKRHTL